MSETAVQKHEAMSVGWVNALRDYVASKITPGALDGVTGSFSCEITDPPKHLLRYGLDTIGWSARIADGKVEIDDRPYPEAMAHYKTDYATFERSMHLNMKDEGQYMKDNVGSKIEIWGDVVPIRPFFIGIDIREGFYNVYTA